MIWNICQRYSGLAPKNLITLAHFSVSSTMTFANLGGRAGEHRRAQVNGVVVGRIMRAAAAPEGPPWLWTLAFGHHEDRTPTHGYEPTREAAMAVFAKSWRRK
jgi:hypothetical protein